MKKHHWLPAIIALAALLQGCIVKSLHPFYATTDVVYKKTLINTWLDQDGNKWTITSVKEEPTAYEMTSTKDGKSATFLAHLFQLEGNLFLDFRPLASDASNNDLFELHLLPCHTVAKVVQLNDEVVEIKWFNERWLNTLFNQNRIKISHEVIKPYINDDKSYVLTASTEELRKFLIKYGNDPSAFGDDNATALHLKRAI